MALRMSIKLKARTVTRTEVGEFDEHETEVTLEDCYVKIERVDAGKSGGTIHVSATSGDHVIRRRYKFVPSVADGSENFIRQGYQHLKTLKEFTGAADC